MSTLPEIYLGIDPGVTGAIAFYQPAYHRAAVFDQKNLSPAGMLNLLEQNTNGTIVAFLERIPDLPKASRIAGIWEGVLASKYIPLTELAPQYWQGRLGLLGKAGQSIKSRNKKDSILKARELFKLIEIPGTKLRHDQAEACLIAYVGWLDVRRRAGIQ